MEITTILISALVGIITSVVTAYITTRLKFQQEQAKWERDLAEKIAELRSEDTPQADRLARQFAVGFLILDIPEAQQREKVFLPPAGRVSVGRAPDNDIVLQERGLSKHHAVFEVVDDAVFVVDLGSTNGVWVNDMRVPQERYKLKSGDIVAIGETRITYSGL
jgi:hypothetical protein